ncbi:tetratricopeptide repeat protein [Kitasatospora sp. NPDC001540]|uniref:tetratricopeptide repeat protein n=1 Tax=Kitasatospora sp. NPDC001540 TaxID=3364014 RepID=UPI0036C70215
MRRLPLLLTAAALCAGLAYTGGLTDPPPAPATPRAAPPAGSALAAAIGTDQQHLRARPDDAAAWARLGGEYVEQARLTADASYYPKADEALHRSLTLAPEGNTDALTGLGALANARHLFAEAADHARRALDAAPLHWQAWAVLTDARTQLGDDAGATDAAQHLLDLHPGTASFTRAAYELEQHGRPEDARTALQRALTDAYDPADQAFCRYQLAELDRNSGRTEAALDGYRSALATDPAHTAALAGQARAEAALGRTDDALAHYAQAVAKVPLPQYLLELGELHESLGHTAQAAEQYRLLRAEADLAAANGVVDDLTIGQFEADHGDPATAVRLLRAEWDRRHDVLVADALAWALHRTGADREALGYTGLALAHGWRNAPFLYHRGEIERALGRTDDARTDLSLALATDPRFSPLQAPRARAALTALAP